ncbi:SIMPL domain-containing protein [bacterium]|nr:SIMPL domain-containing protein [bacterium]
MSGKRAAVAFLSLASLALVATSARAGDDLATNRLSVAVKGQAVVTADAVEIELTVSGKADDFAEAEKVYKERLKRVLDALRGGKVEPKADEDGPRKPKKEKAPEPSDAIPVEVTERGLVITAGVDDAPVPGGAVRVMRAVGPGGAPARPKVDSPMRIQSKVVARIAEIKKLDVAALRRRIGGLVDSAIEAGADDASGEGVAPVIRFVADDPEALRKAAYSDALSKARKRATELATLAGCKVGRVVAVHEASQKPDDAKPAASMSSTSVVLSSAAPAGKPREACMDLSAEVELRVEFAVE